MDAGFETVCGGGGGWRNHWVTDFGGLSSPGWGGDVARCYDNLKGCHCFFLVFEIMKNRVIV